MKENEPALGRGPEQSKSRRSPIILALLAGTALLVAACSTETPKNPTVPTAVASVGGNHWIDTQLAQANDPLIRSIDLYFDRGYSGGSLAMEICFQPTVSGEYRIISRQETGQPGPGYVFNRPFDIDQPCVVKHPVIKVGPDETDKVNVGSRRFNQPYNNTYTGRAYRVRRLGNSENITVQVLGTETLDPESIKPRDPATAKDYFKR